MNKSFLQYFYYVLGEGLSKGIIFLTLRFYTSYFNKSDFGKLSLFWVSVPLFSIFLDFAQRSYVKKKCLDSREQAIDAIIQTVLISSGILVAVTLVSVLLSANGISMIDRDFDLYVLFCAYTYVVIEAVLSYMQIGGNIKGYNLVYAARNAMPYVVTIVFLLLVGRKSSDPILFAEIQLLVTGLLAGFAIYFVTRGHALTFKGIFHRFFPRAWASMKFSIPIIPGILSALLLSFADRFIINFYYGEVEVAEYTVAYTVSSVFMAFFLATNKMWQRFILENLKLKDIRKISAGSRAYIGVVLAIGIVVILARTVLVDIMASSSYYVILDLIPTIILGMFFYFLYTLLSNIPFYNGDTFLMALPAILGALLNIGLNILFIPVFGYKVAALTTTVSYFLEFAVIYIICLKKYRTDILFHGITRRFVSKG